MDPGTGSAGTPRAAEGVEPSARARVKAWARAVGIFFLALCLGMTVSFALDRRGASHRVPRGVVLQDVQIPGEGPRSDVRLAGLDEAATRQAIEGTRARLLARSLSFTVSGKRFEVTARDLGVDVDVEALVRAALTAGRSGSLPSQFGWWVRRLFTKERLELLLRIDPQHLRARLLEWQRQALPPEPPPPGVFYDGEIRTRYPAQRAEVDADGVQRALPELLRAPTGEPFAVPLRHQRPPIERAEVDARRREAQQLLGGAVVLKTADGTHRTQLSPAEIGAALVTRQVDDPKPGLRLDLSAEKLRPALEDIRPHVERPAVSARFEVDSQHRVTIRPGEPGIRIDEEATIRAILSAGARSDRVGQLVLREEQPELTTEGAEALGIRGLVSQFVTRHACCEPRVKNIHFAAQQADGVLLRPGERFSLNELLGPRTHETGFLDAPAIVRGKMKETPGGGISQFATTLFNAVLDGGYEIIQRQPHTYYFARYPEGHEATVSYPLPDLIFRNDTRAGLLIKTVYGPTSIRVLLYGDNEGRRVERRVSERFDIVEPPVELEPNAELAPDRKNRKVRGHAGWSVIATRILHYADGTTAEQSRRVTYKPRPDVVEVHPCNIPKGFKGYTGEKCPEPEEEESEVEGTEVEAPTAISTTETPPPAEPTKPAPPG